jgi:hypothetical protein
MMFIGAIGSCAHGFVMPGFSLIFGLLMDAFNKPQVDVQSEVFHIGTYFFYFAAGALVATYCTLYFGSIY